MHKKKTYSCGEPPRVKNSKQMCSQEDKETMGCAVECAEGHRARVNTLLCDEVTGKWFGTAVCIKVKCLVPPRIPHSVSACREAAALKSESFCAVKCMPGYDLIKNTLTCTAPPHHSAVLGFYMGEAICKPKSCGVPPARTKTNAIKVEVLYPALVTYSCENGFTLNGRVTGKRQSFIHCQMDGNFSKLDDKEVCKPVECGSPPTITNAETTKVIDMKKELVFPEQVSYRCKDGYSTDGTSSGAGIFQVACQASSTFTAVPECVPLTCGSALALPDAHAKVNESTIKIARGYKEEVSYECSSGYALTSSVSSAKVFDTVCGKKGTFSGIKTCTQISCGKVPTIEHATVASVEAFFGMRIQYHCESGYSVNGSASGQDSFFVECRKDGSFYIPASRCDPVKCQLPQLPANASWLPGQGALVYGGASFSQTIGFQCNDGYSLDRSSFEGAKSSSVQCLETGQYTPSPSCLDIDDCVGHTCGPFGHCVDHFKNYTCKCLAGYEPHVVDGELMCGNIDDCGVMACGAGGHCKDLVGGYTCECHAGYQLQHIGTDKVCERIECGTPPDVTNGSTSATKLNFGDSANYQCKPGFTLDGMPGGASGFSVSCSATGQFVGVKECLAVLCPDPPIMPGATTSSTRIRYPENAVYTCEHGRTLDGTPDGNTSFSVSCSATGLFTVHLGCTPVICGSPPVIDMAHVSLAEVSFQGQALYNCLAGYSTDPRNPALNTFSASCQADGSFQGVARCSAVQCPLPELGGRNPVFATISLVFGGREVTSMKAVEFSTKVSYVCDHGYTLFGHAHGVSSFVMSCEANGTLSGLKRCQRVTCGPPPALDNAVVTQVSSALFNDTVSYSCSPGFATQATLMEAPVIISERLVTTFSLQCLANGMFSPPVRCVNIDDCYGHSCGPHGTCVDGIQSYSCDCQPGYSENVDAKTGEKICGNIDDCGAHMCGEHGICIDLVSDYTCECQPGHELVSLSSTEKTCRAKSCTDIAAIPNSNINGTIKLTYPGSHVISCSDGYSIDRSTSPSSVVFTVQCLADGSLTPVSACKAIECGFAPAVFLTSEGPDITHKFNFGETAHYKCADGHTIDGSPSAATKQALPCRADGTFASAEHCKPVVCGRPPAVQKAIVDLSPVSFPAEAHYSCQSGFSLSEAAPNQTYFSVKCLASGSFEDMPAAVMGTGATPQCTRIRCGAPPVYPKTTITGSGAPAYFGDVVSYNCEPGSTIDGTVHGGTSWTVTCNADGQFSSPLAVSCQVPVYTIAGKVLDATNNNPVKKVTVSVKAGMATMQSRTDSHGMYSLAGVPAGPVEVTASKSGYISVDKNISLHGDIMSSDEAGHLTLSPVLPPSGWRVVLTWGSQPLDLDSHMYFGASESCHMYYSRPRVYCSNGITSTLDVDDTRSYGPETTTLTDVGTKCRSQTTCKFIFRVKNYSRRPDIATSKAVVKVYTGDRLAYEFKIESGDGHVDDIMWAVFSLDGKTGTVQKCSNQQCH